MASYKDVYCSRFEEDKEHRQKMISNVAWTSQNLTITLYKLLIEDSPPNEAVV